MWQQQFQYNGSFARPGGPVFLLLGGEGPASPVWLSANTAIMTYALRVGAAVYQLEHRFYGKSQPFADLTTEHLKLLSSRQALADANNFVKTHVVPKHGADTKVISFGGSYSGALSAWLRLKYPETIFAAVSTSSPIVAIEDFVAYQQVVQNSLATTPNGKSCVDRIRGASGRFQALLKTAAGRDVLGKAFQTCAPIAESDDEQANVMASIAGSFDGVVQYNIDNRGFEHPSAPAPPNITEVCAVMNTGVDPDVAYFKAQAFMNGGGCLDVSYSSMISEMQNTSLASDVAGGARQWVWQTCTEFGYFQSSDGSVSSQPFGTDFPVKFSVDQCTQIYGMAGAAVGASIDATNHFYGAANYTGSRVVFVNGDIDPWHALSLPPQPADPLDVTSVLVHGTAHCANMYPPSRSDLPGLTAARSTVESAIMRWAGSSQ